MASTIQTSVSLHLTYRPFLSWEGKDSINNKARITGCPEDGFLVEYYDESEEQWISITAGGRAQWILEGFLADCMAKQAEPAPDLEISRAIQDARERFWDEPPTMQPYIEATVKELGLKGSIPAHLVEQVRRLAYGAAVLDGVAFPDTAKQAGVQK